MFKPNLPTELLHSKYGFSAQSRIMACGASVPMSAGISDNGNAASELGTAVHECVEVAYNYGLSCKDFIGCTFNKHVMTEENAEAGDVMINYIRQLKTRFTNVQAWSELKVCMSSISNDLWGTSDFVLIGDGVLYIIDFKNGYGLVEVNAPQLVTGFGTINGSAQLMGYALATMDELKLWGTINKIVTVIVQPNNHDHIDGVIRSKEYTHDEIVQWHQAYRASHKRTDIVAGTHCIYCKAHANCAKRIERTMTLMGFLQNLDTVTSEQIIEVYKELPTIKRGMYAIEERVTELARKGQPLKDHKLVKGIVRGFCTNEAAFIKDAVADLVHERFSDVGEAYDGEAVEFEADALAKFYNKPKLKGMTACKSVVNKAIVDKWFDKPKAPYKLVPITNNGVAVMPDQRPDATNKFKPVG